MGAVLESATTMNDTLCESMSRPMGPLGISSSSIPAPIQHLILSMRSSRRPLSNKSKIESVGAVLDSATTINNTLCESMSRPIGPLGISSSSIPAPIQDLILPMRLS